MVKKAARSFSPLFAAILAVPLMAVGPKAGQFPDPAQDVPARSLRGSATAVLAGGCFWGVEAIFERLRGVLDVVSGFAGGSKYSAHYEIVSMGGTGHAESVEITYDPSQITYGKLLKVFFSVVHDPTQLNRQGPDEGTEYRSSIFYANEDQKQVALAYIQQLRTANVFERPIVTTVVPLEGFYAAEDVHQHFLDRNRTLLYIVVNDLPKLKRLQEEFPALVRRD